MTKPTWLEVSVTVNGELAEAVSEVISRFALNGTVIENLSADFEKKNILDKVRVVGYLPADKHLDKRKEELEKALWYLGRIQTIPEPVYRFSEEKDWSEAWKKHYKPIPIGRRLEIVPAWLEPTARTRIPLKIEPGMAFGTGTHPTTQLCLQFIETVFTGSDTEAFPKDLQKKMAYIRENPELTVFDIGCGSGILSIGALLLGAKHTISVDIDPAAIQSTRENAALNHVGNAMEVGIGSVTEIIRGDFSTTKSDFVIANILTKIILKLFDNGFADLLTDAGIMVLSGILETQLGDIEKTIKQYHLKIAGKCQIDDWIAVCITHL